MRLTIRPAVALVSVLLSESNSLFLLIEFECYDIQRKSSLSKKRKSTTPPASDSHYHNLSIALHYTRLLPNIANQNSNIRFLPVMFRIAQSEDKILNERFYTIIGFSYYLIDEYL